MAGLLQMTKKPTDIDRELVLSYYKNEFQKIMALEEEFKMQLKNHINLFHRLSSFFPTASYLALTNELSSKGYKALLAHYEEVKRIKDAFLKKYLEMVYFSDDSKVEPFLKGDANVLTAKPALPDYFLEGILIDLLWIAAFLIPSYFRFKKKLDYEIKKISKHYNITSKSFKSWNIFSTHAKMYKHPVH
jgi:ABC-type transport system involved in multi-copper enzyme maturation permease subunit